MTLRYIEQTDWQSSGWADSFETRGIPNPNRGYVSRFVNACVDGIVKRVEETK